MAQCWIELGQPRMDGIFNRSHFTVHCFCKRKDGAVGHWPPPCSLTMACTLSRHASTGPFCPPAFPQRLVEQPPLCLPDGTT
eukprot:350619-Chlamydomonas_euryale.AAC.2